MPTDQPTLDRRKGRLVNKEEVWKDGRRHFVCDCDCGRERPTVTARAFNDGKETACSQCKAEGKAPDLYPEALTRATVSLDTDTLAVLGYDAATTKGQTIRQLLKDYASLVAGVAIELNESYWNRLRQIVITKPELLTTDASPKGRLLRIVEGQHLFRSVFDDFDTLQCLSVLAALRWGVDHLDDDGEWWKPEHRTGDD